MNLEISKAIAYDGFIIIRELAPNTPTLEVAAQLGSVIVLSGFSEVQSLRPRDKSDSTPNTYSGIYGKTSFPLHTDLAHWAIPPRYIALRCIQNFKHVATHLCIGNKVIEAIGSLALQRTLVQPRRSFSQGKHLLRLLQMSPNSDTSILRWDKLFLRPATIASAVTHSLVDRFLDNLKPSEIVLVNKGDTLIIDNWRMLHGRGPAVVEKDQRHIDRVYLKELN